jgi:hypothetical protein
MMRRVFAKTAASGGNDLKCVVIATVWGYLERRDEISLLGASKMMATKLL